MDEAQWVPRLSYIWVVIASREADADGVGVGRVVHGAEEDDDGSDGRAGEGG